MEVVAKNRDERIEGMCKVAERARILLPPGMLPDAAMVREAVDGVLNMRTGLLLAGNPNFRSKPIANVFRRLLRWHSSGGELTGLMIARFDCDDIADKLDITGPELFDRLNSLAIVLRRGSSPASDNWKRALAL